MAESTDTQVPAAGAGADTEQSAGEHVSEYTTETGDTAPGAPRPAARKPVVTGNALGTGRRKEAIARVRILPGTLLRRITGAACGVLAIVALVATIRG